MSSSKRQIAKAAGLVMVLFVASRLLGLLRQMVIGAAFGTSGELDAYMAAARIPEMIFLVVAGGALGSAFIPTFAGHLAQGDAPGGWRLASAIVNLVLVVLALLAIASAVLAPLLVRSVIAPGFSPAQQQLTSDLLRLMMVSPIIFGVSGVVMGALNAHQHFLLPALAPSLYNLSIILGAVFLGPRIGVRGLALGVVLGSVFHLLIQVPALVRHRARYTLLFDLVNPSVREVGRLMAPRVVGTAIAQLNFVVNNSLASLMGEGAVSAINYAWMLMLLPQGVFAQAVGTAAFPTFSAQAARQDWDDLRDALSATLRAVFFLCLPATAGLIMLGRPLVALLFERGAFAAASTDAVTWALVLFAIGLVGHAGLEIVARAFYALHDTFTPVWVGAVAVTINVGLSVALSRAFAAARWPPHAGLALANSIATLVELGLLLWLVARRLRGLQGRQMAQSALQNGLAALLMAAALWGWQTLLPSSSALLAGAGGTALGTIVFLAVSLLLGADEPRAILRLVRARARPGR